MKVARAARRRPFWFFAALIAYAPAALFVDSCLIAPWPWQYMLGAATLVVLVLATRRLDPADRSQVWLCVVVATAFEYLGSQIWGGYRYRFGAIPAFVPFGHGLIYVFAIALAQTNWVRRYERIFTYGILAVAVTWAVAGLAALPVVTGRIDVHGMLWLPLLAYVLLFTSKRAVFAAIFIATTEIELTGTWLGSWAWMETAPWFSVPSGNPPSAIAGGYTVIDGSVLVLVTALTSLRRRRGRTVSGPNVS